VSAEITARCGDTHAALNHIRQADHALSTQGEDPAWLDFFDRSRWAAYAGEVYLLAGKRKQAATHLQHALSQLRQGHKQRPVVLLDLATVQAADDAAAAAALAHEALDCLDVVPYAAAMARVRQAIHALQGSRFAAEIRDRVRTSVLRTGL
jgi:ATP/maltotriose-dependent transcriptional regulator MalT